MTARRWVTRRMDRVQGSRVQGSGTQDLRGLKALVIGLGVLIVLGTALVIGVVVKRVVESTTKPAEVPSVLPAPGPTHGIVPFATTLPAAQGASIGGIAASGGRVAIWIKTGHGGRIVFVDPRSGKVAGTVTLAR